MRCHYLRGQSTTTTPGRHFIAKVYVELSSRGSDVGEPSMNRALVYELPSPHDPLMSIDLILYTLFMVVVCDVESWIFRWFLKAGRGQDQINVRKWFARLSVITYVASQIYY